MPSTKVIKLFYCCSDAVEDEEMRQKLEKHLSILKWENVIAEWHQSLISPGKDWEFEIDNQLKSADIILLLISSELIASDYYWKVVIKQAIELHKAKQARIIPVLLRPCDNWKAIFGNLRLKALPKGERPVTSWKPYDNAFTSIAEGIRETVAEITDSNFLIKKYFRQVRVNFIYVAKFIGNFVLNILTKAFSLLFQSPRTYRRSRRKIISPGSYMLLIVLIGILLNNHIQNILGKPLLKPNTTPQSSKEVNPTGWIWIGIANSKSSSFYVGEKLIQHSNRQLLPSIDPPVIPSPGAVVTVKYKVNLRREKTLSANPLIELQPGEKLVVLKVEPLEKTSQNSRQVKLRAQVRKCNHTCNR